MKHIITFPWTKLILLLMGSISQMSCNMRSFDHNRSRLSRCLPWCKRKKSTLPKKIEVHPLICSLDNQSQTEISVTIQETAKITTTFHRSTREVNRVIRTNSKSFTWLPFMNNSKLTRGKIFNVDLKHLKKMDIKLISTGLKGP